MKHSPTTLTIAGTLLFSSVTLAHAATTSNNPFVANALPAGYMLADSSSAAVKTGEEAKCGANKAKEVQESKCSADAAKPKQLQEAKCGEAKCGANNQQKKP